MIKTSSWVGRSILGFEKKYNSKYHIINLLKSEKTKFGFHETIKYIRLNNGVN